MNNNKLYVGVVTYHRANNYGAVLQAYALCQYLHKLGCNSEIVDYWPNYHAVVYRPLIWDKKHLQSVISFINWLIYLV